MPQGAPKSAYIQGLSVIGVQQIDRIVEMVEQTLNDDSMRLLGSTKAMDIKKKYGGPASVCPRCDAIRSSISSPLILGTRNHRNQTNK